MQRSAVQSLVFDVELLLTQIISEVFLRLDKGSNFKVHIRAYTALYVVI
jgi:hypothetical protein